MKTIKTLYFSALLVCAATISSCSCQSESEAVDNTAAQAEIEQIAINHAQQFSGNVSSKKQQQLLFEIRAHEQDLRENNLNNEAEIYIKRFTEELKNINPELAKSINL